MKAEAYVGLFAATMRRMIVQSGAVAKQAAKPISEGKYTADEWVKSATQLADIAALGLIELAENAIAGPGAATAPIEARSDPFTVPENSDTENRRSLEFSEMLTRAGTKDPIPSNQVTFVSPEGYEPGTIPYDAKHFRFKVDITNLPSGVYTGKVKVHAGEAEIGTVDVDIAL